MRGGFILKKFDIRITETLERIVSVSAENENRALKKVMDDYESEEIVLDCNDFKEIEIKLQNSEEINHTKIEVINKVKKIKKILWDKKQWNEEFTSEEIQNIISDLEFLENEIE